MKKLIQILLMFLLSASTVFAQPTIKSFTPDSGPIGTKVTITGTKFSATPTDNIVYFGCVRAKVSDATTTSLTVTVPEGANYKPITVTAKNLTAYSNQPFIVTISGGGCEFLENSFAAKVDYKTADNPCGIASGDLDGDGKVDLAVANYGSNTISLYRNTSTKGKISFDTKIDLSTALLPLIIVIGDVDGDTKPDVLVSNRDSYSVLVFLNKSNSGTISFDSAVSFTTGPKPYFISLGDFDGDGKADLAVANYGDNTVSILKNTSIPGSVSFAAKVDYAVVNGPFCVAIGDLDGDGKADLAVTNNNDSIVSVLRNTSTFGTISFAPKLDFATASIPEVVSMGDLDGDSKADIAVANKMDKTILLYRNISTTGNISFDSQIKYKVGYKPWSIEMTDLDGDGKTDIAVSNKNSNCVSVLKNISKPGSFSFISKVDYSTGENPNQLTIVDFDLDGKSDFAVTNFHGTSFSVLRNQIKEPTISNCLQNPDYEGEEMSASITGTNFTGATAVSFGDTPAISFIVNSPTKITAFVKEGFISKVFVTTPEGTASFDVNINMYTATKISSFSPAYAISDTKVTITGTRFTNVNEVSFGGTAAKSFTIVSPSEISAVVGNGSSGSVALKTRYGTILRGGFTFGLMPEIR